MGKKNGELLRLVTNDGFNVFITVDRNLPYQQNLYSIPFSIIVLCAKDNRRETLKKLIPKVLEVIQIATSGTVVEIS